MYSVELLYEGLKQLSTSAQKRTIISFFNCATDDLKERKSGEILRYILLENDFFEEKDKKSIFQNVLEKLSSQNFENNPELKDEIEKIEQEIENTINERKRKDGDTLSQKMDQIIADEESGKISKYDMVREIRWLAREALEKGYPNSIDLLYKQLEHVKGVERTICLEVFFDCASDDFKVQNIENILKYVLIEKAYFEKEEIERIVQQILSQFKPEILENNPELRNRIEEIKNNAINPKPFVETIDTSESSLKEAVEEIPSDTISITDANSIQDTNSMPNVESSIPEILDAAETIQEPEVIVDNPLESTNDKPSTDKNETSQPEKQMQALENIRKSILPKDFVKGLKFITSYVEKIKKRLKKLFKGGDDNYDNR